MVMGILSRLGSQWTAKLRREGQPLSKKNKPALYFQSPDITKCFDSVDLAGVAYPHIRCHTTCAYECQQAQFLIKMLGFCFS